MSTDLNTLATDFTFPGDPANVAALLAGDPVAAAAASTDPTGLSADFSSLLASLGATAGSDALSQSLSDLSTQFAADFANLLPGIVLSSSALDADGPSAQRWGSDCYAAGAPELLTQRGLRQRRYA